MPFCLVFFIILIIELYLSLLYSAFCTIRIIFQTRPKFDSVLTELQMKLYLTMCGREQKLSQAGDGYGWYSTVFCTTETFWPPEVFEQTAKLTENQAVITLSERITIINPSVDKKKLIKFIRG